MSNRYWTKDDDFIRDKVPMTKSEVRILTMAALEIREGVKFLDIGAGTGSISVAAASLGAHTTACECNDIALDILRKNISAFGVNCHIIEGVAPTCLDDTVYDCMFIGGSRGNLGAILTYAHEHLAPSGILCGNFVTLKNTETMRSFLELKGYDYTLRHIAVSREDKLGILRAENGVFMLKGKKQ